MNHLVLLGDSIFDNEAYVNGGLTVFSHLYQLVPKNWEVTLRAIDGSVVKSVTRQALDLPNDTTHLIISVGGNDAILNADVLQMKVSSSAEVFDKLADYSSTFEFHYCRMLEAVLRLKKPTAVCTIYYPQIPEAFAQKITVAALASFNDIIIKQAFLAGLPLIDLRLVCNEPTDYANEIEPSEAGGRKIAQIILRLVSEHNFGSGKTEIFF